MIRHVLCYLLFQFRVVSFVGHTSRSLNDGNAFDLAFQIAWFNALALRIARREPKRTLFLAGHSVGARVVLHMMRALEDAGFGDRVARAWLLFPTVFRIADTPNGRTHTPVLRYFRPLVVGAVAVLSLLPRVAREYLLARHIGSTNPFECEAAAGVLQPHVVRNALFMAKHEMVSRCRP